MKSSNVKPACSHDSLKRSGLEGFVLRHDGGPVTAAHNEMGASLAKLHKSTAL
jgi:hypothetical protein